MKADRVERGERPAASPSPSPDTRRRVLLIEDESDIAEAISYQLEKAGLQVRVARTGEEGLEAVRKGVDLVLLDLNLPGLSGLEVGRRIRSWSDVPILILSVREEEADKVTALDLGADDYLTKPFGVNELLARLRVALRHATGTSPGSSVLEVGPVAIDVVRHEVRVRGRQAVRIAADIQKQGGAPGLGDKQIVALIAYLQRLGTDIKKTPALAAAPAPSRNAP